MILQEFKQYFKSELKGIYDDSELDAFLYRLIDFKLGLSIVDIIMQPEVLLTKAHQAFFNRAITDLKQEKPIQYILGETDFYGFTFNVTPATLIPRPETEELVSWILSDVGQYEGEHRNNLSILDIGTGTGCIPISLAKNLPEATIYAVDISKEALAVAKENTVNNEVQVTFIEQNILTHDLIGENHALNQQFDVIVSNPPYVRELEKDEIKKNVLDNEPHLALFVEDTDALLFYREISKYALNHLKEGGTLYFEINQYLGKETLALIKELSFTQVELRKDLLGNDRMIKATL